jgi:hypothetical protein
MLVEYKEGIFCCVLIAALENESRFVTSDLQVAPLMTISRQAQF